MSSLTETAYYARKTINWSIIALAGYILLRLFWSILVVVFLIIFPPRPPEANEAFGVLPKIKFPPPAASPSAALTFRLETIEGTVPPASESASIYFMPKSGSNYLALSKTQDFAKRLGFQTTPVADQKNKNVYRFDDTTLTLRHLWYDIVSGNFIIKYNFENDAGLFLEKDVPTAAKAQSEATTLLQTYGLYPPELRGGQIAVAFYKANGATLSQVASLSQADAARIDFYRPSIAGTPILSSIPNQAPINITLSGSKNAKKRLLEFNYTYWPIDSLTFATYNLKPGLTAWQELQSGQGYIVRYPKNTTATIRKVYLAYYDTIEPQTYLQPVFVFEGDDDFLAYVPAVVTEWVEH